MQNVWKWRRLTVAHFFVAKTADKITMRILEGVAA